jgi:hypothetical protein
MREFEGLDAGPRFVHWPDSDNFAPPPLVSGVVRHELSRCGIVHAGVLMVPKATDVSQRSNQSTPSSVLALALAASEDLGPR